MACWKTLLVVMVMPDEANTLDMPSTVCEICFITSTPSICTVAVAEGPRIRFWDVSEAALSTVDLAPNMVPALRFPQLTLVKTDEELEPQSEGARNEDGVDGAAEISRGACVVEGWMARVEATA